MRPILMTSSALLMAATAVLAEQQSYDMSGFDEVEVSAGVEVIVTIGDDFRVMGEAISGDIDNLDIMQKGNRLMISRDANRLTDWSLLGFLRPDDKFVVTVAMPNLKALESTSGSVVDVSGAAHSLAAVTSTSGSEITISDAAVDQIRLSATSGSALSISGTCDAVEATATSGASLTAQSLSCAFAKLDVTSGASLSAFADKSAEIAASSGASLTLYGGAEVTKQSVTSGASARAN